MHEVFLNVNGVPTKVITWGRWVEEAPRTDDPEDIIICIPGSPGVSTFYIDFLRTLHEELGFTTWILSHSGHDAPLDSDKKWPPLKHNEELYDLQGQVNHKLAFIESYVPNNARVHIIGHSIGAYIILQLLKDSSIKNRFHKAYLLFPAIENLAETTNGRISTILRPYLHSLTIFLIWLFTFLPNFLQKSIVRIYINSNSAMDIHTNTIISFMRPDVLQKILYMADDQLQTVRERNSDVLLKEKDKLKLYYGVNDRWVPLKYYQNLKRDIPDIDAEICTRNFHHAFMLRSSVEMGLLVASWIKESLGYRQKSITIK